MKNERRLLKKLAKSAKYLKFSTFSLFGFAELKVL